MCVGNKKRLGKKNRLFFVYTLFSFRWFALLVSMLSSLSLSLSSRWSDWFWKAEWLCWHSQRANLGLVIRKGFYRLTVFPPFHWQRCVRKKTFITFEWVYVVGCVCVSVKQSKTKANHDKVKWWRDTQQVKKINAHGETKANRNIVNGSLTTTAVCGIIAVMGSLNNMLMSNRVHRPPFNTPPRLLKNSTHLLYRLAR